MNKDHVKVYRKVQPVNISVLKQSNSTVIPSSLFLLEFEHFDFKGLMFSPNPQYTDWN